MSMRAAIIDIASGEFYELLVGVLQFSLGKLKSTLTTNWSGDVTQSLTVWAFPDWCSSVSLARPFFPTHEGECLRLIYEPVGAGPISVIE